MLLAACCCLVSTVWRCLRVVRCVLFVACFCYLLFAVCWYLFVDCCRLCVADVLFKISCLLRVACCALFLVCWLLVVVCCLLCDVLFVV